MVKSHIKLISREVLPALVVIMIIAFIVQVKFSNPASMPFWASMLLLAWLNRDPNRNIPLEPLSVIAPVDGRITAVEEAMMPLIARPGLKIALRRNFLQVFRIFSPTEGKIHAICIIPVSGKFPWLNRFFGAIAVWIKTDEKDDVLFLVKSIRIIGRSRIYAQTGARVGKGQRMGYCPFAFSYEVYMPLNSRLLVKPKQKVTAVVSEIAEFVHKH